MIKRLFKGLGFIAVCSLVGIVCAKLTLHFFPDTNIYASDGALVCITDGQQTINLPSKDIHYLGNGEWSIVNPFGDRLIFVKGLAESCFIAPAAHDENDTDKIDRAPSPPIVGDKNELKTGIFKI